MEFLARCVYLLSLFIGKIGYGAASEVLAYKLPLVFVRRDYFNEEPFLRNLLEVETYLIIYHARRILCIVVLKMPSCSAHISFYFSTTKTASR
jgi:hypothetical protein